MIDNLDDIEKFGIDLKLRNQEEEDFYCEVLRNWFEEIKGYHTYPVTTTEFNLGFDGEQSASVYIEESILRIKIIKEDPYEVLICILEFIAENHRKTIQVYDYLRENDGDLFPSEESEENFRPQGEELRDIIKEYLEDEEEEDSEDEWI